MIFIGGYGYETSSLYGPVEERPCLNCNGVHFFILLKVRRWITLFFIPIIPVKTVYRLQCENCKAVYDITEDLELLKKKADLNNNVASGAIDRETYDKEWRRLNL